MDRRDFLINSFGASALLFLKSSSDNKIFNQNFYSETQFVIGNGKEVTTANGYYYTSKTSNCSLSVSTINGDAYQLEAPCKAHEIVIHPGNKNFITASSKWGNEAFIADLKNKSLVKVVTAAPKTEFYGHSVFSKDGNFIFMTMMDFNTDAGFISVRETKTLTEVKKIPTYGRIPHQLRWIEQDKTVAVINSIGLDSALNSKLSLINVQTGELVKFYETKGYGNTHFSLFENNQKVFMGRNINRNNYSFYQTLDMNNGEFKAPEKIIARQVDIGECLSHIILEDKKLAVMTLTGVNEVVIWNYKNNEIVATFQTEDSPRGIALSQDKKTIAITFSAEKSKYINLYKFDSFFNQPLTPYTKISGGNGSHLTLIS